MRMILAVSVCLGAMGCAATAESGSWAPPAQDASQTARSFFASDAVVGASEVAWGTSVNGGRAGASPDVFWAGMGGVTCSFDDQGENTGDWDASQGGEEVQDILDLDEGALGLVITTDAVLEVAPVSSREVAVERYELTGAQHARFADAGFATVRSMEAGCQVDWSLAGVTYASVELPVACERSDFAMDASEYNGFLATADGVFRVNPDGAWTIGDSATAVSWDDLGGRVLLADGAVVQAVDAGGAALWQAQLQGEVEHLESLTARGELLAIGRVEGRPHAWVFALQDGSILHEGALPSAVQGASATADGRGLMLLGDRALHLLTLDGAW